MSLIHPATNFAKYFKMKSPGIARYIPSKDAVEKVKRDLFGPVDRESAKQFADKEIAKHQIDASNRWNFDFIHGHPIISHHNQFVWERVVPSSASLTSSSSSSSSSTSTSTISTPSTSTIQTTTTIAINTNLKNNNQNNNTTTSINYDNHSQHLKNLNHLLEKQRLKQQQQQQNSVHLNLTELDVKCSKYRLRTAAGKRQPKITEYLKERKSISPKSKKILRPRRITIAGALSNN